MIYFKKELTQDIVLEGKLGDDSFPSWLHNI